MDVDRQRDRKVGADDGCFARPQVGKERGRRTIDLAAGALHHLAVPVIGQSVHDQGTHLAEYVLRNVTRALARKADIQAVLPALLGDHFEGIQLGGVIFGADVSPQKVVRLIDHDHCRSLLKHAGAGLVQEMAADDIGDDLARVELVRDPTQIDAQ